MTYNYKFMLLDDKAVSTNQSRGMSLQFNGYVPFNGSVNTDTLPDVNSLVASGDITLLFNGLKYIAESDRVTPADESYESFKENPGEHMFNDLYVSPSEEFSTVDEDGVNRASMTIELSLSDNMFGDNLEGNATIDGIVLYGQAYNRDFYNDTAQGRIEKATPIAIIVFNGSNKPEIIPDKNDKTKSIFRMTLSFRVFGNDEGLEISDDSYGSLDTWKSFRGQFHVVNNDMLTTSSFVIRGRGVEPVENTDFNDQDSLWKDGSSVDFHSRVFFTNDVPNGSNFDHNVDFGSPARLTVLNREEPTSSDQRSPQMMLGKVSYWKDGNGFKHGYWDGVAESYYAASDSRNGITASGSVYDIDWVSHSKPAISLFSTENDYLFADSAYGDSTNSACFANGTNLFSVASQSVGDGVNFNTVNSKTRGNALVMNSTNVVSYSNPDSDEYGNTLYDTLVSNSRDISILNRVPTSTSTEYTKNRDTIISSKSITVDNMTSEEPLENGRVHIMESENIHVENSDNVTILEVKSKTIPAEIKDTQNLIAIGGSRIEVKNSDSNLILSIPGSSNTLKGKVGTRENAPVKYSVIIGSDNVINAEIDESTNDKLELNVFEIGNQLSNDARQSERTMSDFALNESQAPTTIILGKRNQKYFQENQVKSVVVGGFRLPADSDIPAFDYNSMEHSISLDEDHSSSLTLTDVMGRTLDYSSKSINLGITKGRSNAVFEEHNFKSLGSINLYKLYQLLKRLRWVPDGSGQKGYVYYDSSLGGGEVDYSTSIGPESDSWKMPWSSYSKDNTTILADLVDDSKSKYEDSPKNIPGR